MTTFMPVFPPGPWLYLSDSKPQGCLRLAWKPRLVGSFAVSPRKNATSRRIPDWASWLHLFSSRRLPVQIAAQNARPTGITAEGDEIVFTVEARSFLHHQVRNMVGTLKLVGSGQLQPEDVKNNPWRQRPFCRRPYRSRLRSLSEQSRLLKKILMITHQDFFIR